MFGVLSGIIAATLYGNIGIKVIYNNILMELFKAPPLTTKSGKLLWAIIVPFYWTIAFILAGSIPDFFGLTSLTAAVCFVQFTYTFPGALGVGFFIQKHALRAGEGFDPATGNVVKHDTGFARWKRGFFAKRWWLNVILILYTMGSLAISGLGTYSACKGLIAAFAIPQINAFTCVSPLNLNP